MVVRREQVGLDWRIPRRHPTVSPSTTGTDHRHRTSASWNPPATRVGSRSGSLAFAIRVAAARGDIPEAALGSTERGPGRRGARRCDVPGASGPSLSAGGEGCSIGSTSWFPSSTHGSVRRPQLGHLRGVHPIGRHRDRELRVRTQHSLPVVHITYSVANGKSNHHRYSRSPDGQPARGDPGLCEVLAKLDVRRSVAGRENSERSTTANPNSRLVAAPVRRLRSCDRLNVTTNSHRTFVQ